MAPAPYVGSYGWVVIGEARHTSVLRTQGLIAHVLRSWSTGESCPRNNKEENRKEEDSDKKAGNAASSQRIRTDIVKHTWRSFGTPIGSAEALMPLAADMLDREYHTAASSPIQPSSTDGLCELGFPPRLTLLERIHIHQNESAIGTPKEDVSW